MDGGKRKRRSSEPRPEQWKQKMRKRLRQSGQQYVNTRGENTPGRQVREGCRLSCNFKCNVHFTEQHRLAIHNDFWSLNDDQKTIFYWKHTSRVASRKRTSDSRRAHTFLYRFALPDVAMLPVCAKFFLATLDIAATRIYHFYEHCFVSDTCLPHALTRGLQPKKPMPNMPERIQLVREHIASFPTVRTCECEHTRFLPSDLSFSEMFRQYEKATAPTLRLKQHWYRKVFNEEFNLRFESTQQAETHQAVSDAVVFDNVAIEASAPASAKRPYEKVVILDVQEIPANGSLKNEYLFAQ